MQLAYFDENKYCVDNPYYYVGGLIIDEKKTTDLENVLIQIQFNFFGTSALSKSTEFHGKEIFHGKEHYKGKSIGDRLHLLNDLSKVIINHQLVTRIVCINVNAHRNQYAYPIPEYHLGLMLILERICDYLDQVKELGIVFGDYEKDEIAKSVLDFSQFKFEGKTPMYYGRPLGLLIDSIYFTQSHYSRFLQLADIVVFMAQRYENGVCDCSKWLDQQVKPLWENIKANTDLKIQHWL